MPSDLRSAVTHYVNIRVHTFSGAAQAVTSLRQNDTMAMYRRIAAAGHGYFFARNYHNATAGRCPKQICRRRTVVFQLRRIATASPYLSGRLTYGRLIADPLKPSSCGPLLNDPAGLLQEERLITSAGLNPSDHGEPIDLFDIPAMVMYSLSK